MLLLVVEDDPVVGVVVVIVDVDDGVAVAVLVVGEVRCRRNCRFDRVHGIMLWLSDWDIKLNCCWRAVVADAGGGCVPLRDVVTFVVLICLSGVEIHDDRSKY